MPKNNVKNIVLLLQGQFVSSLGNQIFDIAMLLWIKELTGSAAIMGLAMLLTSLPEAILAPLGGAVADRWGRVKTIIHSDVVSGLSLGIVIAACLFPVDPMVKVAAVCITNLFLGVSASCFVPAASALIPSLTNPEHLARINSANQFSRVGAKVIGQAVGGIIYVFFGVLWAFIINALSFFLSALSEKFIDLPEEKKSQENVDRSNPSLWLDTKDGIHKVWNNRHLRLLVLNIGMFHLFLSALPILLPFVAEHTLKLDNIWLGFLYGAYTVGILAGFLVAGALPADILQRTKIIAIAAAFVGLMFNLTGLTDLIWLCLTSLAFIGLGIGVIIVNLLTELQLSCDKEERGRVMGAAHAVGGSSLPIGMALFGMLTDGLHSLGWAYQTITSGILVLCGASAVVLGLGMLRKS